MYTYTHTHTHTHTYIHTYISLYIYIYRDSINGECKRRPWDRARQGHGMFRE